MANQFVIDAHALVWFFEGSAKLGLRAKAVMEDPASVLILPAISLAEALWAVEHGKTVITSADDLIRRVRADPRITVTPLDSTIVERTLSLAAVGEMHDRQIVATALLAAERGATVAMITKDANILASGLVTVIW